MDWVPRSVRSRAREIERAIAQLEATAHAGAHRRGDRGEAGHHARRSSTSRCSRSPARRSARSTSSGRAPPDRATRSRSSTRSRIRTRSSPAARSRRPRFEELIGEAIAALPGAGEARHHALLLRGADPARDRRGARRDRVPRLPAPHEGDPAPQGAPRGCRGARHDGAIASRIAGSARRYPPTGRNGRSDARGELHSFGRREPRGRNVRPCQRTIRATFATSPSSVTAGPGRRHSSRRCSSSRRRRTGSGTVEQGSTVADWDEDEHKRQMSLSAALCHLEWQRDEDQPDRHARGRRLPGRHVASLRVVEGRARRRQRGRRRRGADGPCLGALRAARRLAPPLRQHARPRARGLLRRPRADSRPALGPLRRGADPDRARARAEGRRRPPPPARLPVAGGRAGGRAGGACPTRSPTRRPSIARSSWTRSSRRTRR